MTVLKLWQKCHNLKIEKQNNGLVESSVSSSNYECGGSVGKVMEPATTDFDIHPSDNLQECNKLYNLDIFSSNYI